MINKHLIFITIIFSVFLLPEIAFSQDYTQDSLAVRAILDSNDMFTTTVDMVTDTSGGRIVGLYLQFVINTIPSEIGSLTGLKTLHILDNKELASFPSEIGNLENLITLKCTYSSIRSIPKEIENLTNLEELILQDNDSLVTIPKEIGNLSKLKHLNLVSCNITSIPPEIGNLNKLEKLYLSSNNISEIPSEIGNLSSLIDFQIMHSTLTSFPSEIGSLSSLESLIFYGNSFSSFPLEITTLTNLNVLNAGENKITSIPDQIGDLLAIRNLNIGTNLLTDLPLSITQLTPEQLSVDYNNLNPSDLPQQVIEWLDMYDPNWKETQNIIGINKVFGKESYPVKLYYSNYNSFIYYNIPTPSKIQIELYNLKGRHLLCLVNEYKNSGEYKKFLNTNKIAQGLYILRLTIKSFAISTKIYIYK